jgi:hypothetical protein
LRKLFAGERDWRQCRASEPASASGVGSDLGQREVSQMRTRVLVAVGLAVALTLPAWGAPQDKELEKGTKALAGLVADSLAEVTIGKPIHVSFRPLEPGSTPKGALVPFFVSGRHATNDAAEYVAYFHEMPEADQYELDLLKTGKLPLKHFMLVDFREVGGRMWQSVDWSTAKSVGHTLVVKTATWKESDSACCPTGEGAIEISLDDDIRMRVKEVRGAASQP